MTTITIVIMIAWNGIHDLTHVSRVIDTVRLEYRYPIRNVERPDELPRCETSRVATPGYGRRRRRRDVINNVRARLALE